MNYLMRAFRLALRQWITLTGIVITSMLVAVCWAANIGAVYPAIEVAVQKKSMHDWADDTLHESLQRQEKLRAELKTREARLVAADLPSDRAKLESKVSESRTKITNEEKMYARILWIQPWIQQYLPDSPFRTLVLIVLFLLVGTLLKCVALCINLLLVQRLSERVTLQLRSQLFEHTLNMELAVFGKERSTDLLSRMSSDMSFIGSTVGYVFGKAMREPLKAIVCLVGAALISWRLLVISLLICPVMIFVTYLLTRSLKRANRRLMEQMAQLFGRLSQALTGVQVVKAFTMEKFEADRFKETATDAFHKSLKITFYNALTRANTEVLGLGIICAAILAGGYLVVAEQTHLFGIKITERVLDYGSLFLFYGFLIGISDPVRKLADMLGNLQAGAAAAERVYPLLDRQPSITDPARPRELEKVSTDLIFDRVSFHYTKDQPVLDEVSLRIPYGESLAIIGPNGCGKSTLINLIPRFYDPTGGAVRLGFVDLRELRQRDLRRHIGMVTQNPLLFDDSVANNIRYGAWEATHEDVVAAAKKAHAHQFILDKLTDGYDTNVGEFGGRLSGGQRQRISLARAILRDPEILILDEATSQIDPESEQLIHEALKKFTHNRTTIMVTHRMSTLDLADRILVMNNGGIADLGTHDELMDRCELYQRLYQSALRESA